MYQRNIKLAYAISFINELYFPIAVWLFFYLKYLTFTEIALLTTIKVILSNAFEIPTGAFADRFGRKISIVLSILLWASVMFATAFATKFWMFIMIESVRALAQAFYSGSLEALTYDSLVKDKRESLYNRVISTIQAFEWTALFISSVIGGLLFLFWYRAPYLIQGGLYIVALILALRLTEIKWHSENITINRFITQSLVGFRELFRTQHLRFYTLLFVTIGVGYFFAAELLGISQMRQYGADSRIVGVVFGTGYIISAIASKAFMGLNNRFDEITLLVVSAGVLVSSFLLANFVGLTVGTLLIVGRISSSTTFRNVRSMIINRSIKSENRATSLSTLNLLTQLPFTLFATGAGYIIQTQGPNKFALILGITLLIVLSSLVLFAKPKTLTENPV